MFSNAPAQHTSTPAQQHSHSTAQHTAQHSHSTAHSTAQPQRSTQHSLLNLLTNLIEGPLHLITHAFGGAKDDDASAGLLRPYDAIEQLFLLPQTLLAHTTWRARQGWARHGWEKGKELIGFHRFLTR